MKYRIAIGCLIQWYEADIVEEYFKSLSKAVEVANRNGISVLVELEIGNTPVVEYPASSEVLGQCVDKIKELAEKHLDTQSYRFTEDTFRLNKKTIGQYRFEFNVRNSMISDILVWGESDMLCPSVMFYALDQLGKRITGSKWIATFATCKMWDDSWKALEHPKFSDKAHSDSNQDWWSLNYVMSYEEMEEINKNAEYIVRQMTQRKFNGCGLAFSRDIILGGANIPLAAYFVHEDTGFMRIIDRLYPQVPQYHFDDILLVHNRKHPQKRNYIIEEKGETIGQKRKSNAEYVRHNQRSELNVQNLLLLAI